MKQEKMIEMLAESLNNIAEALDNNIAGIPGGVAKSIKDAGHSIGEPIDGLASEVRRVADNLYRIDTAFYEFIAVVERLVDEED